MKTVICGSRYGFNYGDLCNAIDQIDWNISTILSGGARGVDTFAIDYAELYEIPLQIYRANWDKYGKSAGMIRNKEMVDKSEAILALWNEESKGTQHMIGLAKKYNKKLYIYTHPFNFDIYEDNSLIELID